MRDYCGRTVRLGASIAKDVCTVHDTITTTSISTGAGRMAARVPNPMLDPFVTDAARRADAPPELPGIVAPVDGSLTAIRNEIAAEPDPRSVIRA